MSNGLRWPTLRLFHARCTSACLLHCQAALAEVQLSRARMNCLQALLLLTPVCLQPTVCGEVGLILPRCPVRQSFSHFLKGGAGNTPPAGCMILLLLMCSGIWGSMHPCLVCNNIERSLA